MRFRRLLNYVLPELPKSRSQCGTGRGRLPAASAAYISVEIKAPAVLRGNEEIGRESRRMSGRQDEVFQQPHSEATMRANDWR